MHAKNNEDYEDDGRVIADMSGVGDRQPLLVPKFGSASNTGTERRKRSDFSPTRQNENDAGTPEWQKSGDAVHLTREERRTIISGSLAAGFLVAGVIAAGFALLILLIGHL